jgi:ketosteroid isomerase-like protein
VKRIILLISTLFLPVSLFAQARPEVADDALRPVVEAERSFEAIAGAQGIRQAYLDFFSIDSVIFRPGPTNGQTYWKASKDPASLLLSRNVTYADISSNGMMGYTTGNWRLYERGKSEASAKFGQYVTIWEKRQGGKWVATIDMTISHDKLPFSETDRTLHKAQTREANKIEWSPADASMNFTRASMAPEALAGAFEQYAGDDIRFLRDDAPPILGKKDVIKATRKYRSIRFPTKIALYQSADMAYTWNPCKFADNLRRHLGLLPDIDKTLEPFGRLRL